MASLHFLFRPVVIVGDLEFRESLSQVRLGVGGVARRAGTRSDEKHKNDGTI